MAAAAAAALPQDDGEFPPPDSTEVTLYDRPPPDAFLTPYEYIWLVREDGGGTEREKWIACFVGV